MQFKKLFRNVLALTLLQAVSYLVPLLLLPFIISKVGLAEYGAANYVMSIFIPLKILVDYGYNLSAIKDIANHKGNLKRVSSTVSSVIFTKLLLLGCIFVMLLLCIWMIPVAAKYSTLLLLSFVLVAGQSLIPIWYFQAMEKAGVMVVFSVATRILYISLILFYIEIPADHIYLNFYLGIADLLLSIFAISYIIIADKVHLSVISIIAVGKELKKNFSLANVNVLTTLSLGFPLIFLGVFSDKLAVGYYSVADKILQVLRTSVVIIYGSSFPRVIDLFKQSMIVLSVFVRKLQLIVLLVYIPMFVVCCFFPQFVLRIIVNDVPGQATVILKIFSVIPLIAALDIIPSHLLLITNRNKLYAKLFLLSAVFSVVASSVLVYYFNYTGAAVAALLVECFILSLLVASNRKMLQRLVFHAGV